MDHSDQISLYIVEDNPVFNAIVSRLCIQEGFAIQSFKDAETAWDQYQQQPCDIAILDIILPKMTGTELCKKIKNSQQTPATVVMISTASEDPYDYLLATEAGAEIFHFKNQAQHLQARLMQAEAIFHIYRKAYLEERTRNRFQKIKKKYEIQSLINQRNNLLAFGLKDKIMGLNGILTLFLNGDIPEGDKQEIGALLTETSSRLIHDFNNMTHGFTTEQTSQKMNCNHEIDHHVDLLRFQTNLHPDNSQQKDITFVKKLAVNLPLAQCHRGNLGFVIHNVLINASEAIAKLGQVTITTGQEPPNNAIIINISDDGCGIPPQDSEIIFRPNYTTKTGEKAKQAGMGLSFCRDLVEKQGGTIFVKESELGKGTTITIHWPAVAEDE